MHKILSQPSDQKLQLTDTIQLPSISHGLNHAKSFHQARFVPYVMDCSAAGLDAGHGK